MNSTDTVMMIETNVDDMNPQYYQHIIDLLFEAGSLDAYLTPIIMKKGRPGVKLSVLSPLSLAEVISEIILRETTTIGIRMFPVDRIKLDRVITEVQTGYGTIRIKVVTHGTEIRITPEYDDCLKAARNHKVPLSVVDEASREAARALDLESLF